MSDLISRQDAIDALNGQISVTGDINAKAVQNYIRMVNQRLHDLPSALPEHSEGLYVDGYNNGYRDGWKEGREALRREIWEDGRDRLD